MKQKIYQVDAFSKEAFSGNPAAVCPLEEWLSDEQMQNIAMENNLAETAFYVKSGDKYEIRWFTPKVEVDLCGHATLAAAFILFNNEGHKGDIINFVSLKSGPLTVSRNKKLLTLNFPTDRFEEVEMSEDLVSGFDLKPLLAFKGKTDYLLIFENENQIINIEPNLMAISKLGGRGVIVSAKGEDVDFVSRFFAPQSGIDEDPVTGSAHTTLVPYWAKTLGKDILSSMQLSKRKGWLFCKLLNDRVEISGQCRLYLSGEIYI